MTRDELDETLDRMQASSRARGDTESSPGLITVESSHWVGHIAEVRARCASLQDGLRYRDIKIHVSSTGANLIATSHRWPSRRNRRAPTARQSPPPRRPWLHADERVLCWPMPGFGRLDAIVVHLNRPEHWQAFEALCRDLLGRLFNDIHSDLHGRTGQAQGGVDLWAVDRGSGVRVRAQCKMLEGRGSLDEATIRALVQEVKAGEVRPDRYMILTRSMAGTGFPASLKTMTI